MLKVPALEGNVQRVPLFRVVRHLFTLSCTCLDLSEQSHQDFRERRALVGGCELFFCHQIAPTGAVWSQACFADYPSYIVLGEHVARHCRKCGRFGPVKLDLAMSFKAL